MSLYIVRDGMHVTVDVVEIAIDTPRGLETIEITSERALTMTEPCVVSTQDARWRTDAAPRGVRCLVTFLCPTGAYPGEPLVDVARLSPDHNGEVWLAGTARIPNVIAWMPAPEPADPTRRKV